MKLSQWHRQKNQQNKTAEYILHLFVDHEITIITYGTLMNMFLGTKVVKIRPIHIPKDYFTNYRVDASFLMEFQGKAMNLPKNIAADVGFLRQASPSSHPHPAAVSFRCCPLRTSNLHYV